jgi:hypothetical protein
VLERIVLIIGFWQFDPLYIICSQKHRFDHIALSTFDRHSSDLWFDISDDKHLGCALTFRLPSCSTLWKVSFAAFCGSNLIRTA